MNKVIVITGAGGMGLSCIRRFGAGYKIVLCDFNLQNLEKAAEELKGEGFDVHPVQVDIANAESVKKAAEFAVSLGSLHAVIHTAGLSPTMASAERITEVDLVGTARVLFTFEEYLSEGTVGVFVSSSSSYLVQRTFTADEERTIGSLSSDELAAYIPNLGITEPGSAYTISKYCNRLQVAAAAIRWGKKGARIMSVSPGIISTPMGQKERKNTPTIDFMINNAPVGRVGTASDIAALVEFIISPAGNFLSGSDILIDGGVTPLLKMGMR